LHSLDVVALAVKDSFVPWVMSRLDLLSAIERYRVDVVMPARKV
jgi:hypothetical protein